MGCSNQLFIWDWFAKQNVVFWRRTPVMHGPVLLPQPVGPWQQDHPLPQQWHLPFIAVSPGLCSSAVGFVTTVCLVFWQRWVWRSCKCCVEWYGGYPVPQAYGCQSQSLSLTRVVFTNKAVCQLYVSTKMRSNTNIHLFWLMRNQFDCCGSSTFAANNQTSCVFSSMTSCFIPYRPTATQRCGLYYQRLWSQDTMRFEQHWHSFCNDHAFASCLCN